MTYLDCVADLFDEFRSKATAELEKCHSLWTYENGGYFGVVLAPTEKAEQELKEWYENNRKQNDRLEEIKPSGAVDILMDTDMKYDVKCGCQWVEY